MLGVFCMKKILYISTMKLDIRSGVTKKILQQIEALTELGYDVAYTAIRENSYLIVHGDQEEKLGDLSNSSILYNLQILKLLKKYITLKNDVDIVYIRKLFCNPIFLSLLRKMKKKGIKIIEEIPTYPYDEECKQSSSKALHAIFKVDKLCRHKEKKYIHHYVTYSEDQEIFGLPAVPILNGINVKMIHPIQFNTQSQEINILCLAALEYWQGYDRLIRSLAEYKKNAAPVPIFLHIVGDGTKMEEWRQLAMNLDLEDCVFFHGFLDSDKLDNIFNKCQLGCAPLGASRKGLKKISSLKVKEYIARGLPFIYSTPEAYLDDFKYALKVNDDENLIDLSKVVHFYRNISSSYNLEEMQKFALDHYDWKKQMHLAIGE